MSLIAIVLVAANALRLPYDFMMLHFYCVFFVIDLKSQGVLFEKDYRYL